jgi:lysine 6-dehydrogenase
LGRRVAVVGAGRIGLRAAWVLEGMGYDVVVIDSSSSALRRASEVLRSAEHRLADASSPKSLAQALRDVDYALLALPGSMEAKPLEGVIEAGIDGVDVSFYRSVPGEYEASARRAGVRILLDAGVAPGLSNMLIAMAHRLLGRLREGYILVGGVSRDPNANPLGLAATWNAEDLIDEYLRPARILSPEGIRSLDPLSSVCRVRLERVGVMEAFPTDGLRSLLYSMRGRAGRLVEYTLRYPGHVELIAKLKALGFLSENHVHVDGCMVRPRALLARLIELKTSNTEDMVILAVTARGEGGDGWAAMSVTEPEGGWSAMARVTAAFAVAALRVAIEGERIWDPGLHYPEELGFEDAYQDVIRELESQGITVEEADPGVVSIEECREPPTLRG